MPLWSGESSRGGGDGGPRSSPSAGQSCGREYQQRFEHHGCSFFLSAKAADTRQDGKGRITAVVLDDGTNWRVDFVIVAAGVRPEIRFLQNCSVQVDRSVQVDNI